MDKTPFLNLIIFAIGGLSFLGIGIYGVWKTSVIRKHYMKNFDVGSAFRWYSPRTYLRKEPPITHFMPYGLLSILVGLFFLTLFGIAAYQQYLA